MKSDKKIKSLESQLKQLRNYIEKSGTEFSSRNKYIIRPLHDFTRRRKLDFVTTVVFIIGLLKKV